jgi:nitrate/TMAO reductase-like tetraheme cytochrome c subunit
MSDVSVISLSRQPCLTRAAHRALGQWRMLAIVVGSAALGWGVFATWTTAIEFTNHTAFCIACHVMKDTVFRECTEYSESKHSRNQFGVPVGCLDCHVSQYNWLAEAEAKIGTIGELYAFFFGGLSNVANFKKTRPAMAKDVWTRFDATNARECRHCNEYGNMALDEQKPSARLMHQTAMTTDRNCVACHKDITHKNYQEKVVAPAPASFDVE